MLRYLQTWIGFVALMAIGNTLQCFWNHSFMSERLYTGAPRNVNGLTARLFGVWTLLAAILRFYCAFYIRDIHIYNMTLVSFILAFGHFLSELLVYRTALVEVGGGVIAPIIVSGISVIWMLVGYKYLNTQEDSEEEGKKNKTPPYAYLLGDKKTL